MKRLAKFVDRGAKGMVEIDYRFRAPNEFRRSSRGDYLARPFDQRGQYLEGLALQVDANPEFTQFSSAKVGFEHAKTNLIHLEALRHTQIVQRGSRTVYSPDFMAASIPQSARFAPHVQTRERKQAGWTSCAASRRRMLT